MGSCCGSPKQTTQVAPVYNYPEPEDIPISLYDAPSISIPVTPISTVHTPRTLPSKPVPPKLMIISHKTAAPSPSPPPPSPPPPPPRPPSPPRIISTTPFSHTGLSTTNPLKYAKGYENEPLVTLEEALAPLNIKIDHLKHYIHEAKTKCFYPSNPKLTLDESAAIYIYTLKWGKGCVYDKLQEAWESNQTLELKPWFKYLKLCKSAFDKLPDATGEIWQGKENDERLQDEINTNSSSLYTAMDLLSNSKADVQQSLNARGITDGMLISFNSVGAKSIKDYTADGKECVLIWPGANVAAAHLETSPQYGTTTLYITGSISKILIIISSIVFTRYSIFRS